MSDCPTTLMGELRALQGRAARRLFRRQILDAWPCCAYCGAPEPDTLDHVRPRAFGGATVRQNLVGACAECNRTRGTRPWLEFLQDHPNYTPEREEAIRRWITER